MQCSAIKSRVGGKVELFGRSPLLRDRLGISLLVRAAEWLSLHHFFPSSFLNLLNCFYLDPWVFSLLLFLFIRPPHLMGSKQAAVWCLAFCCCQPTTVISKRAGKKYVELKPFSIFTKNFNYFFHIQHCSQMSMLSLRSVHCWNHI